jgi:TrmH family RNA methyltransferase
VQAAIRLRDSQGRRESGLILAEGPAAIGVAVSSGVVVEELFVTAAARHRFADIIDRGREAAARVIEVSESVMAALAETSSPQGMVATCRWTPTVLAHAFTAGTTSIILEGASDPGNAGTIIRTADACGAGGLVLTDGSVDPSNGKCVRASAGSIFHLPIATGAMISGAIEQARSVGQSVVVATGDGEEDLVAWLADRPRDTAICWIFGSEAHGVTPEARAAADARVRIPILGRAESLNVASAAAVCLYAEVWRQHGRLAIDPEG